MENSYCSAEDLEKIGFKEYGRNLLISRKVSFFHPEVISIGDQLWPDTIASLGEDGGSLPEVYPGQEKRIRRVDVDLQQGAVALRKLYLLDYGDQHEIVPVSPAEAAIALVSHTYGVEVFHNIAPREHFVQCTELVKTVPVCRLRRKMSFDHLPALISLLEDDLRL